SRPNAHTAESIDWARTFPDAAEAGGFDLVIGNPPYLRERDAKPLFDHLAQSPLGQRWRQARMDLWYYFLHRAIDLARPGGTVCFIVNSYWVGSQGARKLIDRIERETTPLEFTRIEAAPIFPGVAGRHLIVRLRKGRQQRRCRVIDLSHVGRSASEPSFWHRLAEQGPDALQDIRVRSHWADRETLFQHGRISLAPPMETSLAGCVPLDSQFEVRQGIAENPPCITAAHVREFGERYRVGQGVFVLDRWELAALQLSPEELACVRPYDETVSIGRYRLPAEASHAILYLTKHTAPMLERLPRIAAHLEQFRPLLERRREVQKASIAWWHLHWPREERLFVEPRILSVQMGRRPQFVYAERPTFVGFSVNVVTRRDGAAWSLPALTAILNSSWAAAWFERHAKHRGVHLEINGNVLRRFPLPPFDAQVGAELARLSLSRHQCVNECAASLEAQIDALVNGICCST
ncbi:MAG TPA: TaqI-like C-terminal specificity domain-containing protein, partial [Planctomycetaceae bacterium]|nr:TaqI-like C-terminal specificity domain-containing protein [Planctomycetaceae bacterium]